MATNRVCLLTVLLLSAGAGAHETASPSACQAAASQPAIARARAALDRTPGDLRADFALADAWSDAGCFNDALRVLQSAEALHASNKELETRLRVARSLVGEAHYFDNLDRANEDAKLKRNIFRCNTLADADACQAVQRATSGGPARPTGQAPEVPASVSTPAAAAPPTAVAPPAAPADVRMAKTPKPLRRYSNAAPEAQSH